MSRTLVCALALAVARAAHAQQSLETETARTLPAGRVVIGQNLEFQTSGDGTELAFPFSAEVGITNRFEFLVEPVPYTAIRPAAGTRATGWGDLEVTLTYLVARETTGRPAVAFAGEVKVPTAHNAQIGTGKTDYAFFLIGSRRFGRVDVHANVGYTIVGQPGGVRLANIYNAALAFELPLGRNELFGEVLGNTASQANAEQPVTPPGTAVPEAAGGEVVATLGVGRWFAHALKVATSVSIDNNGAVQLRPGVELRFD